MTESSFCVALYPYLLWVLCPYPRPHTLAGFHSKPRPLLFLAGCEGASGPRHRESPVDLSCRERPEQAAQLSTSGLIPTDERYKSHFLDEKLKFRQRLTCPRSNSWQRCPDGLLSLGWALAGPTHCLCSLHQHSLTGSN